MRTVKLGEYVEYKYDGIICVSGAGKDSGIVVRIAKNGKRCIAKDTNGELHSIHCSQITN